MSASRNATGGKLPSPKKFAAKVTVGQCGVHIRPHVIQQLERPANEEFFHCETCTRILYYSAHHAAQAPASAAAVTPGNDN